MDRVLYHHHHVHDRTSAGGSDLHDDGLGLGEELAAEGAALAADAGVADAAERGAQIADEETVNPDRSGP